MAAIKYINHHNVWIRVRQEPKASVLAAYKICDLAYKILKLEDKEPMDNLKTYDINLYDKKTCRKFCLQFFLNRGF
jgi:hypothetical protein